MRTVIAGGHGQIALRLERQLAARGDSAVGLIRDPAHADDLRRSNRWVSPRQNTGRPAGRPVFQVWNTGCT